jgi:putative ABC transport system ATP-binding protein
VTRDIDMAGTREVVVQLRDVTKEYRGLRPLRVRHLELREKESLALLGFDQLTAEVLVDLITGATRPDTGEVTVFGKTTAAISDSEHWLQWLDQFALLSERAVLVDALTAEQNIAIPLSLEVENMPDELRRNVRQLASETGLADADLQRPIGALTPASRLRVRLGRALALAPRILLAEHPNASMSANETPAFAADLSRIVAARELASLVLTADRHFAAGVAERVLTLQPATGELKLSAGWRRWFS